MNDENPNSYSPLKEENGHEIQRNSNPPISSPENNFTSPKIISKDGGPQYHMINQDAVYTSSFKSQLRGLFKKNFALQSKQMGTNICQVT